ncbi:ShlB/FhaC/HecB family hemolysin secretion/activation protein [Chromobacterium haemolyticum]|nr:ShlB/FhaC/HecB family hemolysin secretion/activation protein [Chromobacterium haemolyticum]
MAGVHSSWAWSNTHPSPDQALILQQERERALQEQVLPAAPDVRLPRQADVLADYPATEAPCFAIHELRMVGELAERFRWALAAADAVGRCLGAQGVNLAMKRVQNALIAQGYVTTRVLVTPQDLKPGVLTLTLIPGRIQSIRFAEPASWRARWSNALPARPGDVLNLRDIEQALENFKRVPTADADADIQIEPAGADGKSDLVIAWKETLPIRLSLSLDDGGSEATGRYQGSATLSLDNLLTVNDLFYYSQGKDLFQHDPLGSKSRSLHYSLPLGYWQLGLTLNDYRYHQTIAGANEKYLYRGDSENSQLNLSRVVFRSQAHKTTLSLRAYQRKSRNFVEDTEIRLQHRQTAGWELGLNQRSYLGDDTLDAGLNWRRGTAMLGALPAPEEETGSGGSRPSVVTADLSYNQPLQIGAQKLRINSQWRGQWSKGALVPQDRFVIGGRYTVRGFDGDLSLSSERGWLWRNELSPGQWAPAARNCIWGWIWAASAAPPALC